MFDCKKELSISYQIKRLNINEYMFIPENKLSVFKTLSVRVGKQLNRKYTLIREVGMKKIIVYKLTRIL